MSETFYKTPPIQDLNFNYTENSVVRFFGSDHINFFTAYNLDKQTLINLINRCIELSDDVFHVSYQTYQNPPILYISENGLQSKAYWFNMPHFRGLLANAQEFSCYFPISIENRFYDQLGEVAEKFSVSRGDIAVFAILAEFLPDEYLKDGAHHRSLSRITSGVDPERTFPIPTIDYVVRKGKDYSGLDTELAKLVENKKLCNDLHETEQYSYKLKAEFLELRNELKFQSQYDSLKYIVKAKDINGNVLRTDELPITFIPTKIDTLFGQNLEHYQGVYSLEVTDPFSKDVYTHFPSLPNVSRELTQPCNLTMPNHFFSWFTHYTGQNSRFRMSILNQSFENILPKWLYECEKVTEQAVKNIRRRILRFTLNLNEDEEEKTAAKKPRKRRSLPKNKTSESMNE